ncbi:ABC transporter substrate-binding protein [Kitasatospora phosalacinea]|uniref:ABC transporter substrate-binding protein n=1 Tax=Kitasatospora phosalacinea TaxID=2065 RepID=UPI00069046E4|nr:ABC transporter substrate-binding protein [Kitasatospora phosalacinea]
MTRNGTPHPPPAVSGRRRAATVLAASAAVLPALLSASACGGPAAADAAGQDVTVMTWAPSGTGAADRPGMTALAEAVGRELNARGGLAGHKVRVLTCNEHDSTDGATACADQAVSAHVVAVVGSASQYGSNFMPILEQAGIPFIGGYGLSSPEFSSPLSYPVNGGMPALVAGSGRQLVAAGCKQIALIRPDTRAGDALVNYLSSAVAQDNVKITDVKAPEKSNDYSSYAHRAIGDDKPGNCVLSALGAEPTANLLDPYRRASPRNTQLASVIGSFQQSVVDSTGGDGGPLRGAYATGWFPVESSTVWDGLRDTVRAYGNGSTIDVADPGVQTTWVAYEVLRQAAGRIDKSRPVTAKALQVILDSGDPIDTAGTTPPLNWSLTNMLPSADSPRLVNTSVTFQRVQNGRLVEQHQGFTDVRWVLTNGKPPA